LAPKVIGRKGFHKDIFTQALKKGYSQARVDGKTVDLKTPPVLSRFQEHEIDLLIAQQNISTRTVLDDTIRKSLREGNGNFFAVGASGRQKRYSDTLFCPRCLQSFEPLDPRLFSFNSKHGACPRCAGMGFITDSGNSSTEFAFDEYMEEADTFADVQEIECPACRGRRLKDNALAVRIKDRGIWDVASLQSLRRRNFFAPSPFLHASRQSATPLSGKSAPAFLFL
jgi:excinuclease ABC subunit A